MCVAKRLGRIDVAGKAAEFTGEYCLGNCRLVGDCAARHVDEDRIRLHPRKLPRADQTARAVIQRCVQGNNIGFFKQFVERHAAKCIGRCALVGKHTAAERLGNARHLCADRARADNAPGLAAQLVIDGRELVGNAALLVFAARDGGGVCAELFRERQRHQHRELRDAVRRIALDVADRHARRAAGGDVHIVIAGGKNADQFQMLCRGKVVRVDFNFVDEQNVGVCHARAHFVRRAAFVAHHLAETVEHAEIQPFAERGGVQYRKLHAFGSFRF